MISNNRRKTWLLTSVLWGFPMLFGPIHAEAAFNLHLIDINEKEVIFPVDETLHFNMSDGSLVVSSANDEITVTVDQLKTIRYSGQSAVNEVEMTDYPQIRVSDNAVVIVTGEKAAKFSVYSSEGRIMMQGESNGETRIPFSAFDKGIYILQVENSPAIKFAIR